MIHKPIHLKNLSLSFPHKTCFEEFNIQIAYGNRIAIIGSNGSGKSTLLKMLQEIKPPDVTFSYIPQIIEDFNSLSGGERFNEALTAALKANPNVLLLDEPTNHLDRTNRKNLMRLLQDFSGTLIIVSHDPELLRNCVDSLWHIENEKIQIFSGYYDDYIQELKTKSAGIEQELSRLERQKKNMHIALMKEQHRAAKSKAKGAKSIHQRKWPTVVSAAKASRAEETSGRKKSAIDNKKDDLAEQLANMRLPEIIKPKFSLTANDIDNQILVTVRDGVVKYELEAPLIQNINLTVFARDRIAIIGDNGSGKSTLVKAILGDDNILKEGDWVIPKSEDIGYLDQHYRNLDIQTSVLESISLLMPSWTHAQIRKHLNDFLFRKNEEVNALLSQLSGGEKARLSLAQIAAKTPKLLILDEITNNLDLGTREHVIQVLKVYPGAIMVISHDEDFLEEIAVQDKYLIKNGAMVITP
jgi:ATPase subunit of ABC transporter with duplicated ATPase domains